MTGTNVTVVGPRAVADLTFPARVPLLVILPRIVALVAHAEHPARPPVWTLTRSVGGSLNMQGTVADNRVAEGEVLCLVNASGGVRAPVVRDLVEVVEDVADRTPRWSPTATRTLAAGFVLAAAAVIAATGNLAAPPLASAIVLAVAAGVLLLVLGAGRRLIEPRPGLLLSAAALVASAGCGVALSRAFAPPSAGVPMQQVGGGLLWAAAAAAVGAAVARWVTPAAALVAAGAVVAAVVVGASGAALWAGSSVADVAAIAGYGVLLVIGVLPAVATALGRVLALDDNGATQAPARVVAAQDYLTALLWTCSGLSLIPAAVLACAGEGWSLALALLLSAALLLATRSYSARRHVLALVVAGLGALLITAALTALRGGSAWEPVTVLGAAASVAAAGVVLLRPSREARTQAKLWLGRLEIVVLLAGPAVVLGALGIYRLVADALS